MFNLKVCKEFIIEQHKGQKRVHGTPFHSHPIAVAEILKAKGFSEEYQVTGLFHDLLEDTEVSEYKLFSHSNLEVLRAVRILTKEKDFHMEEYMRGIKSNDIATMVKLADRIHNLTESIYMSLKFRKKYIAETKEWFVDMVLGTVFEEDLEKAIEGVEQSVQEDEKKKLRETLEYDCDVY